MSKQITAAHHLRFQNMAPLTIHIPPAVPITSQPRVQGIRDPPVFSEDLTTSATIKMMIMRTRSVPNSIRKCTWYETPAEARAWLRGFQRRFRRFIWIRQGGPLRVKLTTMSGSHERR